MSRFRHVPILALVLLTLAPSAQAAEDPPKRIVCPICRRANNQQAAYADKASSTLARGALNAAFGWTELLAEPTAEVNAGGNVLFGIGKGIGYAVKRTASGFGELLTFWTPKGGKGYLSLSTDCPICFPTVKPDSPKSDSSPAKPPAAKIP